MRIKPIEQDFAICQVRDIMNFDFTDEYCFIAKTDEELSVVCTANRIPKDAITCSRGWRAFRIEGTLDFSLIGILSKISAILAKNEIGIFAVSTYNTDYILTKSDDFERALAALKAEGYEITGDSTERLHSKAD